MSSTTSTIEEITTMRVTARGTTRDEGDVLHRLDMYACRCGHCNDQAVFNLGPADTIWNPASTKHLIHGPAKVEYTRHPDGGIDVHVSDLIGFGLAPTVRRES